MAVTFVIGNAHGLLRSLLSASNTSHPRWPTISEATTPIYTSSLIELGLILFLITTTILALAEFMLWRIAAQVKGADR